MLKKIKSKMQKLKKLEHTHNFLKPSQLNNIKMKIYSDINSNKKFLDEYYKVCKNELEMICGSEIAMQRKINLSIQMPQDDSALLPKHSDVWSGCSPFEVVVWIPLVDCKNTQSMFVYPQNFKLRNKKKNKKEICKNQIRTGNDFYTPDRSWK